jgi:hypothetical protein
MAKTPSQHFPLGSIDWLETPSLRRWFADWLAHHWDKVFRGLRDPLQSEGYWQMRAWMKRHGRHLPSKTTSEQLHAVSAAAARHGGTTTREQIIDELRYLLTRYGEHPDHVEALKASPWCNHFAKHRSALQQMGLRLAKKHFPKNNERDLRFACEKIISELSAWQIYRGPSPPLRELREQRRLYLAMRWLGSQEDGPTKLAANLTKVFRDEWPKNARPIVFVGCDAVFDSREHFDVTYRDCVYRFRGKLSKWLRARRVLVRAIIMRDDLRGAFVRLAEDAFYRKKGWVHFCNAMAAIFTHLARVPSDEEKFRNIELANFPIYRRTTSQQREIWFPELGRDSGGIRPLKKSERLMLAERFVKTKTKVFRDGQGKSSAEARYGRAMKAVEREIAKK